MSGVGPLQLPEEVWQSQPVLRALEARDVAVLLRLTRQRGASQHRIGAAVGIQQGRVSEILRGTRRVTAFEVIERVADGLDMPDHARTRLGLAPRRGDGLTAERCVPGRGYADQDAAAGDIRRDCRTSARVDVLAIGGLGLIGLEDSLLRPGILDHADAVTVRVLLADPDSPACRRRAEEIGENADLMAEGTRLCLTHLRDLAQHAPLDVRLTAAAPVWRLIHLDDVLYVSVSAPTRKGHWSQVRRLVRDVDEPLFTGFERTYTDLFADARPTR